MKKLLDELTRVQMDAAEKRRLLELGKFHPVTTPPDTTALTEQAQTEAVPKRNATNDSGES